MSSAPKGTAALVSLVVALVLASCGGVPSEDSSRTVAPGPVADLVEAQPVEADCTIATTRATGTAIPRSASQGMRAFMHPPPTETDAAQMVLFAAAYGLEHDGALPRMNPAELLSTYRQGTIEWLANRDPSQRAERSRALIEKHLVTQDGCEEGIPKTEA